MARDALQPAQTALNGTAPGAHPRQGAAVPQGAQTGAAGGTLDAQAQPQRARIADKHVDVLSLMSLPARDLPSYYDPPSSPSAASDSDLDGVADPTTSFVPTTNRGHKLSRLAPHTRRGRLGHHANVDAGFIDETTSTSLVPPAQKRRKLNDLAAASSSTGFAVAPNLHLVPRGVHALSREPDAPAAAYLPPVPQSPLDLLLTPAVQHTLGRKNSTFYLLSASATSLIEQEAELVGALSKVCRGLRGEGFDWRWEGDEERRREREELREREAIEREERERRALEARREEEDKQAALEEAAAAEVQAQAQATQGMDVDAAAKEPSPAVAGAAPVPEEDVKLEQATPVLSAQTAPGAVANPVAVPGLSASATPAPATGDIAAQPAEPSAAPAAEGAPQDVEMQEAGAAPPVPATAEGTPAAPTADAPPAATGAADAPSASATPAPNGAAAASPAPAAGDVPVIAVIPAGAEGETPVPATPAANGAPAAAQGTAAAEQAVPAAAAGAGPSAEAPLALEGSAAPADLDARSAEATPAPSLSEEPRRRSGRVARGGAAGAVAGRHTRSRQSSPEEGYTDEEDELAGGGGGDGASSVDEPLSGRGGAGTRGAMVEEEELPEYAARLIDPEVFVRGLFVSEGEVGMERVVPGPGGGMVGTGQMETLTPNEQEVLLHDCLTDLHRFLADTLEYRSRLVEIRDGTLGVERRRKGMWKCVRTVAMDWLQEEGAGMGAAEGYE
ncbi:hypothetical protein JCM10449v2_000941 [Rhodotorula kratochvilovae]